MLPNGASSFIDRYTFRFSPRIPPGRALTRSSADGSFHFILPTGLPEWSKN
jgi:hypothetical protein